MVLRWRYLWAGIFCLLMSGAAFAQDYPDYEDKYVNDYGQTMPAALEQRLRLKLQALEAARGIEMTILTINRMSHYGHDGAIESFATGLFNYWGIGDATRNDGVLLLVSRNDRKLRVELGSGYGTRLNDEMKRIIETTIVPELRETRYFTGIDNGTNKIIYAITDRYPGEYDANFVTRAFNATLRFLQSAIWWIMGIGAPFGVYYSVKAYRHHQRTKPRICSVDGSKMYWMTDEDEDAHLKKGQLVEERVKAIDYDVWACRQCDTIRIEAYPTWFSSFKLCPKCRFKTQFAKSRTIRAATRSSSGEGVTDHTCKNCHHSYSKAYTIARIRNESSSGGSSGGGGSSSFGGGSSSGGGASGSW